MKTYEYTTTSSVAHCALSEWVYESYLVGETSVLPDGCQDVILKSDSSQDDSWFVSDLSHSAYSVPTSVGMSIRGIRLQPGVVIKHAELGSWLQGRDVADLFGSDQLDEFCQKNENLTHALACLASGKRTVHCVARELGVSLRSLQRLIKSATGQSPYFWFSLARARKAGRSLSNCARLSDAAVENGFSDQAHMNREMKKWFQHTPNEIRTDKALLDLLSEPGYG